MNNEKVSIIMPTYNSAEFIEESINSVLNQTYKDWELIIIDDNSNDPTAEIVESKFCDINNIHYIRLNENSGAAIARNIGIKKATGKFLAFLDSDDIWYPHKLDVQINFMKKNNCVFCYSSYDVINESSDEILKTVYVPKTLNYNQYLKNTIIQTVTVVVDKEKFPNLEMPNIRTRQDFATWLSILKKGHVAYGIDEALAQYRWRSNSLSSNKFQAAKRNWYVYRKIEKLNIFYAVYVFMGYLTNAIKKRVLKADYKG